MNPRTLFCAGLLSLVSVAAANAQVNPCWGDVTLDRNVNVSDLLEVIGAWGPCGEVIPPNPHLPGSQSSDDSLYDPDPTPPAPTILYCPTDVSPIGAPDGEINVGDLLVVIGTWGSCAPPANNNDQAYVVFCDDWTNGNFNRWTDDASDTDPCTTSFFTQQVKYSRPLAFNSQVTCVGGTGGVHRGYPGLRFQGDYVLPSIFMNSTGGLQAPYGFVAQFHNYLAVPYLFNSQDFDLWMSMMTVTEDCSNAWHRVITLNIDDDSMRLRPTHVDGVQYTLGAPAFPRYQWNRVTVYVNLQAGEMHVWQNGVKICRAWFTRPNPNPCQFHFGLYCSGANSDISYYEDDMRIVKLTAPLTNFIGEPTFPGMTSNCTFTP